MAAVIDATVGGESSNSYATLADAQAYNDAHISGAAWTGTNDQFTRALITATRILDEQCVWAGQKASLAQALRWPRVNAYNQDDELYDYTELPSQLVNATCEFARALLISDRFNDIDDAASGIDEVQAGAVKVKFSQANSKELLPPSVASLIQGLTAGSLGEDSMSAALIRV